MTLRRNVTILAGLVLLAASPIWARTEASRTIEHRAELEGAGEGWHVIVDNVFGSVRVTGTNEREIRVTARELIEADSARDLEEAQSTEHLTFRVEAGLVEVIADEAWREYGQRRHSWWGHDRDYTVTYELEIEVPSGVSIEAKTVNDGVVEVRGVTGDFRVANVNGDVVLHGTRGSGHAGSVNGEVDVRFAANPTGDCEFESVNGEVTVTLQSGLAADARFQTLNGEIFSEFDYDYRSLAETAGRREGGRYVLRRRGETGIRIAEGGPELSFETVNGDIVLRRDD